MKPRKRFAQHFLAAGWASKVVAALRPEPGDVFLEIGPGKGALTFPLAASGAPIVAIEVDRDLVAALAPRLPPNVTIVSGDVLTTDVVPFLSGLEPQRSPMLADAPRPARRVRVVGNLPYNVTSPILIRLAEWQELHRLFHDATIMVQREVADRLEAKPGGREYGVLTIMMKLHGSFTRILDLPPGAFSPPPKVRSSVVRLTFGPPPVRVTDVKLFERLVKRIFSQRRKTLANGLKSFVAKPPEVLRSVGIDPRRRPQTLSFEELAALTDAVRAVQVQPVL